MKVLFIFTVISLFSLAGVNAQSAKSKADTAKQMYTCSMHPEVMSNKPGNCPKCGMTLVPVRHANTKVYTCTMHPEIQSSQPGKCPKCGMTLVEQQTGKRTDSSKHKMRM